MRALVVDDDFNIRGVLQRTLSRQFAGLEVVECANGVEALDQLSKDSFSLLVLDLTMPVMDGFDVLESLRRSPEFNALPIVVTTGVSDAVTVKRILNLGVRDYVLKPINPSQLCQRVGRILSNNSCAVDGSTRRFGFAPLDLSARTPVLVVDGGAEFRQFVERMLTPLCLVSGMSSGLAAFQRCLEVPPYAVFVGSDIGIVNGELLTRKLKQHPRLRGIRVVGMEPQRTLLQVRKRGTYDAVIMKSLVPEVFKEGLQSLLMRPGQSARLLGLVPDLKVLVVNTVEETLTAAIGQQVVLRPRRIDRMGHSVSAACVMRIGHDAESFFVTLTAPVRRIDTLAKGWPSVEFSSDVRWAEQIAANLLSTFIDGLATTMRDRKLPASWDDPQVSSAPWSEAVTERDVNDGALTFDFDVPEGGTTLAVRLAETPASRRAGVVRGVMPSREDIRPWEYEPPRLAESTL